MSNRFKQDPEILRQNGKYGHLGGRPPKDKTLKKPSGNPQTFFSDSKNPQELRKILRDALLKRALGYDTEDGKHVRPNVRAIELLLGLRHWGAKTVTLTKDTYDEWLQETKIDLECEYMDYIEETMHDELFEFAGKFLAEELRNEEKEEVKNDE